MSSNSNQNKIYSKYSRSRTSEKKSSKLKYPMLLIGMIGMFLTLAWFVLLMLEIIDYVSGMSYAEVHGYDGFLTRSLNYYLISFITCLALFFIFLWIYRIARKK